MSDFSHDEVLGNMGLTGRQFTDKYEDQVIEMKRSFLEFMKSTRQRVNDNSDANVGAGAAIRAGQDTEVDAGGVDQPGQQGTNANMSVKMTAGGYPVLPKSLEENVLSKKDCETLLRAYLTQHYCKFTNSQSCEC